MKTILLVSLLAVAASELDGLLDSLNVWVELGVKVVGLVAVMGGAWRWMIGPGWRRVRAAICWVRQQLELIGSLDDRLDGIEEQLSRGAEHFERLDGALEMLMAEEAQAVRRAIRTGEPVEFTEAGGVDPRVAA